MQFGISASVQYLLRVMGLFVRSEVGYCPINSFLRKSDLVSWEIVVIAPFKASYDLIGTTKCLLYPLQINEIPSSEENDCTILRERRKCFLLSHRNQGNRYENERHKYIISPLSLISSAYCNESNTWYRVQKASRQHMDGFVQSQLLVYIQCVFGNVNIDH